MNPSLLSARGLLRRSEGIPLRDISSLGAMDWGLARLENSSAAAVAVALWMDGCYLLSLSWRLFIITFLVVFNHIKEDSFDSNHIKEDLFDSNHTNEGGLIR